LTLFSLIGLYEELLLQGSFRGAGFNYVSGDDETGRRVQAFLFPGQDVKSFQDLGQDDGDIVVNGIVSGDDYTAQADALRAAFQKSGPGALVHPWLGTVQVVQKPGRPAKFSFKAESLRICTFTATFLRYKPVPAPGLLSTLLSALSGLRTAAVEMLTTLLAPVALVLGVVSQVESLVGEVETILGSLIPPSSKPQIAAAAVTPLAALAAVSSAPLDATFAATVSAALAGTSAAIAATTTPAIPAAVAPGGSTVTPAPVDGRVTAALLLAAATRLGAATLTAAPIAIPPGPALILCAQLFLIADATTAADTIDFTSQQEAMAWRDTITAAIDKATLAAAALVPSSPTAGAALWLALVALRASWITDMNVLIGTLPPVVAFTPPGGAPVWQLAQFLAGDDPTTVIATYQDLIARNDIFHPAEPPPGPLEVLA
jgi:prophage DNA circulation protein